MLRMFNRFILVILLVFFVVSCGNNSKVVKNNNTSSVKLGGVFHKIKEGESLWGISKAYNVSLEDIIEINDLNPNSILYPNDEIFIPNAKNVITKSIVSKEPINMEKSNKLKYRKAKYKNKQKSSNKNLSLNKKYLNTMPWPVDGLVITEFSKNGRFKSDGMDIAAPLNTNVIAIMGGTVIYSGNQPGYGNIVIIKHLDKIISIYAHNSQNLVKKGQKVKKGQEIAKVGNSGNAQRYQLHFELRKGVKAINPNPYLKKD